MWLLWRPVTAEVYGNYHSYLSAAHAVIRSSLQNRDVGVRGHRRWMVHHRCITQQQPLKHLAPAPARDNPRRTRCCILD